MESQRIQVDPGAVVEGSDGRLGTVSEVLTRPGTGELLSLLVRRDATGEQLTIPADRIESVPSRREVRLRAASDGGRAQAAHGTAEPRRSAGDSQQVRIPIAEERLEVSTRPVELGEVRVHKRVDRVEEVVRESVTRANVEIERVKTSRRVDGPVGPREEGEWLVVPIVEEVLVVQKRLMVTEEVRIRRHPIVEEQEIRETVRRERAEIEDTTGGHSGYREANARDTEADLRREAESAGTRAGESWEHLRGEIHGGSNRPRATTERPDE